MLNLMLKFRKLMNWRINLLRKWKKPKKKDKSFLMKKDNWPLKSKKKRKNMNNRLRNRLRQNKNLRKQKKN